MIGKADMTLYGWKQLVLWSLEHACLDETEKSQTLEKWETLWEKFLHEVDEKHGWVLNDIA